MIQFQNETVTVFQSALYQTTSTVVHTADCVLLVDPAFLPLEVKEVQNYVRAIRGERPLYLLFTHSDFDHIIGYEAFADAQVIGSKGLQEHPQKEQLLGSIRNFDNKYYLTREYPISFPRLDIVIEEDGQSIQVGETKLSFYLTRGHTDDGLFTVVEPAGIWIAGDYLSDFERPFVYQSAKDYFQTLQKAREILQRSAISCLIPGHGQLTTKREEMNRRIDLAEDYLLRLKDAVWSQDQERLLALEKEMPFPSGFTKGCFEENTRIIQEEYGTKDQRRSE